MPVIPPLSPTTLKRLPRYLAVTKAFGDNGWEYVKSRDLSRACDIQEILVRKDLIQTGVHGRQHRGYPIAKLVKAITEIIGWDFDHRAILIGTGEFPCAVIKNPVFEKARVKFVLAADLEPSRIGGEVEGLEIQTLDAALEKVSDEKVDIAVLAVPLSSAQAVADRLVAAGIHAILNFTNICLDVPEDVEVADADLSPYVGVLGHALSELRKAAQRRMSGGKNKG